MGGVNLLFHMPFQLHLRCGHKFADTAKKWHLVHCYMLPVKVKEDFPSFSLIGVVDALATTIHPPPGVGDYWPGIPCQ